MEPNQNEGWRLCCSSISSRWNLRSGNQNDDMPELQVRRVLAVNEEKVVRARIC